MSSISSILLKYLKILGQYSIISASYEPLGFNDGIDTDVYDILSSFNSSLKLFIVIIFWYFFLFISNLNCDMSISLSNIFSYWILWFFIFVNSFCFTFSINSDNLL